MSDFMINFFDADTNPREFIKDRVDLSAQLLLNQTRPTVGGLGGILKSYKFSGAINYADTRVTTAYNGRRASASAPGDCSVNRCVCPFVPEMFFAGMKLPKK